MRIIPMSGCTDFIAPFGILSPLATQQTGFPLFKAASIRKILKKPFDVIHYHNISLVGGPRF